MPNSTSILGWFCCWKIAGALGLSNRVKGQLAVAALVALAVQGSGLVAASLAQEGDPREALAVPALFRRSAEKLGLDTGRLFDEAAGRTDLSGARWLRDVRDAEDAPEDVGYEEADDGEGFRYERAIARQPRRY